jgi:hypothetical protein
MLFNDDSILHIKHMQVYAPQRLLVNISNLQGIFKWR